MEIRDLRSFLAVVHRASFTGAADELGYTQSAVSQHIAALEDELGHRLLLRRPVRPTPAGERLAERVSVRTLGPAAAVAEVCSGKADLALVDGIVGPDEALSLADAGLLASYAVVESCLVVAFPLDHPLCSRARVDLDMLVDAPWVLAPGLVARRAGPSSLGAAPSRGGVVYDGTDLPTLLALVGAGHGVALLLARACAGVEGVATVPLASPRLVHRTELLTLRDDAMPRSRLVQAIRARAALDVDGRGEPS